MQEVTITYKAEVTRVVVCNDEDAGNLFETSLAQMNTEVAKALDADDVHVKSLKYFIREIDEHGED